MKLKALALFALSVFAIFSFTLLSSATVDEPDYSDADLKIISKNLSYRDSIHLLVACDNDGVDPSKIELVVWNYRPESASDTPTYVDTSSTPHYNGNGEIMFDSVFETFGISAKDMPDNIYMATHIKGTDIYSKIYRYSPLEYLYERIALGNPSEEQLAFYDAVIAYSENAQIVLKHDVDNSPGDLNYVAVKGGIISDGYTAGTYLAGSEITISASSTDDFSMWTNAAGEVVSYEPTFTIAANDKASLFISVSGYSITVNVGEQTTTTVHAAGDIVSLNAPVYTDAESGRRYFVGWKNSTGEIISNAASAKIAVTSTDTYTATYSLISDIEASTLLDYEQANHLPIISSSPNSDISIESDYTEVRRRNSTDGYYLRVESTREQIAAKEYVNTFFESGSTANTSVLSFDLKMLSAGFIGNPDSDTVYTLIYTTGNIIRSININTVIENNVAVGFKLTDEGGKELAAIDFDTVYSISVEVSRFEDKTLSSIYLGDTLIDLSEIDSTYAPADTALFSICIGRQTYAHVYIDNTVFYSLD